MQGRQNPDETIRPVSLRDQVPVRLHGLRHVSEQVRQALVEVHPALRRGAPRHRDLAQQLVVVRRRPAADEAHEVLGERRESGLHQADGPQDGREPLHLFVVALPRGPLELLQHDLPQAPGGLPDHRGAVPERVRRPRGVLRQDAPALPRPSVATTAHREVELREVLDPLRGPVVLRRRHRVLELLHAPLGLRDRLQPPHAFAHPNLRRVELPDPAGDLVRQRGRLLRLLRDRLRVLLHQTQKTKRVFQIRNPGLHARALGQQLVEVRVDLAFAQDGLRQQGACLSHARHPLRLLQELQGAHPCPLCCSGLHCHWWNSTPYCPPSPPSPRSAGGPSRSENEKFFFFLTFSSDFKATFPSVGHRACGPRPHRARGVGRPAGDEAQLDSKAPLAPIDGS